MNKYGKVVCRKTLSSNKRIPFIAQCPPCLIGMEACSGAHYWSRIQEANEQILAYDRELAKQVREDEAAKRLMTIPGVGEQVATDIVASAGPRPFVGDVGWPRYAALTIQ